MRRLSAQYKGLIHIAIIGIAVFIYWGGMHIFPLVPPPVDFARQDSLFRHHYQLIVTNSHHGEESRTPLPSLKRNPPLQAHSIDINQADIAELTRLPRIGPRIAERIIAYRKKHGPFRTVKDLLQVKGIGPKTLETIQPFIVVK